MLGIVFIAVAIAVAVMQSNPNSVDSAQNSGVMSQMVVAFVTGLTTGGLSCLAVQCDLLASSLAHQIEQDYLLQAAQAKPRKKSKTQASVRSNSHCPSASFFLPNSSRTHSSAHCLAGSVPISH